MQNSKTKPVICIADDDKIDRLIIKRALKGSEENFAILEAKDRASVIAINKEEKPSHFIIDVNLGADSGFDVAKDILKDNTGHKPIVSFMSGVILQNQQTIAKKLSDFPILQKPMQASDNEAFLKAVQRFLGVSENL